MIAAQARDAAALLRGGPIAHGGRSLSACAALRELPAARRRRSAPSGCSFHAFAWRRLLDASVRDRPQRRLRLDARAAAVAGAPARSGPASPAPRRDRRQARAAAIWRSPTDAPPRVNLLIPTIDLAHFFGGYIAKLNLARRLADAGRRVRIVTVDPVGPLPRDWRQRIEALQRSGRPVRRGRGRVRRGPVAARGQPGRSFHRHDLVDGAHRRTPPAELLGPRALRLPDPGVRAVHLSDGHLCGAGASEPTISRTRAVLDRAAARLLPRPSDRRLRRRRAGRRSRFGVVSERDHRRASPRPARAGAAPDARLLFYARPEPHAARNMFELGVLALSAGARAGGVPRRLGAARDRHRRRAPRASARGRRCARAVAAGRPGRLRAAAARARCRAGPDVHAASQPGADRDGRPAGW